MGFQHRYLASRRTAWIALFAFFLQTLLPALQHPMGMAVAGTLGVGPTKNICLAPAQNTDSPHRPDKAPANKSSNCPICQAVQSVGGFGPSASAIRMDVGDSRIIAFLPTEAAVTTHDTRLFAQPRGPPIVS